GGARGHERCVDDHPRAPRRPAPVRLRRGRRALGRGPGGAGDRRRVRPPQQHGRRDQPGSAHAVKSFLTLTFALSTALPLMAQDIGARLDGRVQPEVRRAVQEIAADAAAHGLPTDPLVEKAIEGGAKRVPAERLIAAVRALAGRLAGAWDAVRAGGLESPTADVVEGGADGLSAGLTAGSGEVPQAPREAPQALRLARAAGGARYPPARV